jgi:hypothetical protein
MAPTPEKDLKNVSDWDGGWKWKIAFLFPCGRDLGFGG